MRFLVPTLSALALAGALLANDLQDHYTQLKDAQAKKDSVAVMRLARETHELARTETSAPKPSDASAAADWQERVEFARQVDLFVEYAVATAALGDSRRVVEFVDLLMEVNPKSQYLGLCTYGYLQALLRQGGDKELAAAQKILNTNPNNEDALDALASGYRNGSPDRANGYATRLVTVMKTKAKPEGVTDADWERKKSAFLGNGYYTAGATACLKSFWTDCERDLKSALPYIGKDPAALGIATYYLGAAEYQIGKLTGDRPKMQEAEKYSEQSAAIVGPKQREAYENAQAMKAELAAPHR